MTVTIKTETAAKPLAKRRQKWWQLLGKDKFAAVAAVILGIVVLTALFGPWLIGDRATRQDLRASLQPPW